MKLKIKRVKEIAYRDQIAVELDINGKWQKGYGTIVVIEGYKFILGDKRSKTRWSVFIKS